VATNRRMSEKYASVENSAISLTASARVAIPPSELPPLAISKFEPISGTAGFRCTFAIVNGAVARLSALRRTPAQPQHDVIGLQQRYPNNAVNWPPWIHPNGTTNRPPIAVSGARADASRHATAVCREQAAGGANR